MKRITTVILVALILILTACGGSGNNNGSNNSGGNNNSTVTDREKVEEMVRDFYKPLEAADNYKLSVYYSDELSMILTKDGDKMHMENVDEEWGYDYYVLIQDGIKYVITDDRTLMEDEFTYDFASETLDTILNMYVYGYLEMEEEVITFTATPNGENELAFVISGKYEDTSFRDTVTGKKEDGEIVEFMVEIEDEKMENVFTTKCELTYGEHVEIPEYKVAVTYDDMPRVESPYKSFGEIIDTIGEDDYLNYMIMNDQLLVIDEKDGRHYQFSAMLSQEVIDQYDELDVLSDDYEDRVFALISDIEIEDCIDFTDVTIPQNELDDYIGSEVQAMVDDGFEIVGFSYVEDNCSVYVSKDLLIYMAEVEVPEDFDMDMEPEDEDFGAMVIKGLGFETVELVALPMT